MKDARLTNPLTVATGLLNTAFDFVEGFTFSGKKGGGGQPAPVTEDGQHSSEEEEEEEEEEEAYVVRACTCTCTYAHVDTHKYNVLYSAHVLCE